MIVCVLRTLRMMKVRHASLTRHTHRKTHRRHKSVSSVRLVFGCEAFRLVF